MSAALADTVEDGFAAFKLGHYEEARDIWKPLAEGGDARANYFMSQLYAKGKGVKKKERLAMEYLSAAARGGHAIAQFNLGNHYNQGRWVEENPLMAAYWWRKSGSQAMPRAQHNLASLYLLGRGVDKDLNKAKFWYQRAAKNGVERAKKALSKLEKIESSERHVVQNKQKQQEVDAKASKAHLKQKAVVARKSEVNIKLRKASKKSVTKKTSDEIIAALGDEWIRKQAGSLYTLQLFATESRKTIDNLLENYQLKRQVAVYRFHSKSRNFYGVSYGRFKSVVEAKTAIAELPKALSKSKPWPRRFSEIQALLIK